MNRFDALLQSIIAILAITALNFFMYNDGLLLSVGYAVALTVCFWLGRLGVRLLRRKRQVRGLADE